MTQKTNEKNEGSHPGLSSNSPPKVDGSTRANLLEAVQTSNTDYNNLVAIIKKQLIGLSVRKRNISGTQKSRALLAGLSISSQGTSQGAMSAET